MKRHDQWGWVYLVGTSDPDGPVKIGYEGTLHTRLAGLQTGSPVKLHVAVRFPAFRDAERVMHDAFAPWRIRGEWFSDAAMIQHAFENMLDIVEDKAMEMSAAADDPAWSKYCDRVYVTADEAAKEARHVIDYYAYARATDDWNLESPSAPSHLLREPLPS